MLLKDKVAIITGGARGMGREFALRFAREGAKIVICDIQDCAPVVEELNDLGAEVLALKTDVTSEADTDELAKKTYQHFGRIDVLVNNAAIFGTLEDKGFIKPFDQTSAKDWERILSVNVIGVFLCSKAVVPYMKKQDKAKIINIASTAALVGIPRFMHYTTSKGGVITMTRAMARALGEFNITVNAIAPGLTWTVASQSLMSEEEGKAAVNSNQILKRFTTPAHIAGAVVFFAADDSDQITGQVLAVNGGEYLY
jgi:3-oxoacyl-[acyl-carrier protein] reductase